EFHYFFYHHTATTQNYTLSLHDALPISGHILNLSILHSHVFLLNSRLGHFSASCQSLNRNPFSRSYRVNLPSSLAVDHSSALVYSTQLRVSVYGTSRYTRFSRYKMLAFASAET